MSEALNEGPQRRIEIRLNLGADDWPEVVRALENLALAIERGEHRSHGLSAGWASSYTIIVHENPTQTGDKYRDEIAAYVAARDSQRLVPLENTE